MELESHQTRLSYNHRTASLLARLGNQERAATDGRLHNTGKLSARN